MKKASEIYHWKQNKLDNIIKNTNANGKRNIFKKHTANTTKKNDP